MSIVIGQESFTPGFSSETDISTPSNPLELWVYTTPDGVKHTLARAHTDGSVDFPGVSPTAGFVLNAAGQIATAGS